MPHHWPLEPSEDPLPRMGWLLCLAPLLMVTGIIVGFHIIVGYKLHGQTPDLRLDMPYACSGTLPDGQRYTTTLTVVPFPVRPGALPAVTYAMTWDDGQTYGIGMRHGSQLTAAFLHAASGSFSVVVYAISPGALNGRWAAGDGHVYPEDCLIGVPAAQSGGD